MWSLYIGGQTGCPYWGTNRMSLSRNKQVTLIGGQTDFSLLGDKLFFTKLGDVPQNDTYINGCTKMTLYWCLNLWDEQDVLFEGKTGCPYCGTNRMSLLGTNRMSLSRNK